VRDQIDCRLGSGEILRFTLFKEGRPLSPMGGNFLFVRDDEAGSKVIFTGQTDNLSLRAQERWAEAQARFGVNALYTRLNITTAVRAREYAELIEALDPPMNAEEGHPPRKSGENGACAGGGY
jgi:hypothetical protein